MTDLYARARALQGNLVDAGYPGWAREIADAISSAGTATEALMHLHVVLGQITETKTTLGLGTRKELRSMRRVTQKLLR